MKVTLKINEKSNVIVCGIGFQAETIIQYFKKKKVNIVCVLTQCFTQQPNRCYIIPSKRSTIRNSFSEVDMMIDSDIKGVPVKRYDMLDEYEKKSIFIVWNDAESMKIYFDIKNEEDLVFEFISSDELKHINNELWQANDLVQELWNTNKYLFSEVEQLKNCLRRQLKSTVYDFHFEFHLVEHCNLSCAGCTHFSSIAEEEFLDIEEFSKDINRLSYLTGGKTRFINLLGGEPLLHPNIDKFMLVTRKAFPNTTIRVVTNGIKLLEMNELFWQSCRDNNIIIGVTQYPINIDYESRFQKIISENVEFESFSGDNYPRDEMWRLSLDKSGNSRPLENFIRCPRANACIFVLHGRVYNCATMANINHFNKCFNENYVISDEDYVDIYEVQNADEMFSKLCNPKPFCRFCNIDNRKYGVKWERTSRNIFEWT